MKTKDLIAALQREDPTGEAEACVGNCDIHCVYSEPAWYDGPLQVVTRDPAQKGFYDINGAKFVRKGDKVTIQSISIYDVIHGDPEVPIECGNDNDRVNVEAWRKEAREAREKRLKDAKASI